MIIRVDLFKPSGKWYMGGDVEVPDDLYIWTPGVLGILAKCPGWPVTGGPHAWNVVTRNVDDGRNINGNDKFWLHMWLATQFQ